jgi:drug/metabolite transporter (DMT)-like permease
VAILETVFLKTKLSRTLYVAVIVTMIGGALIALASAMNAVNPPAEVLLNAGGFEGVLNGDYARNPIFGAVLALVGAIAGSIYITIGRKARANVPTMPYVWIVFSVGGLVAFGAVLFNGVPLLGYSAEGYGWLLALTIVPHLIGHSAFNHALRFFSATMVSIAGQAITVSAAVVAFFIFAEVPGWLEVIGSAIIMFGVTMAIMASQHKRWKQNQADKLAAA